MDTDTWEIRATYEVAKKLEVEVARGTDPWVPSNWLDVLWEQDIDCNLYDVDEVRLVEEEP